jgi:nitrogen fixation NifU-like protein
MPGLEDLYREIILDHYRTPRNRGELPPPAAHAVGHNPLCGDEIDVYLQVDGDTVTDVKVSGQGCSISQSSASMMSQAVKGRSIAEVRALVRRFKGMMSIEEEAPEGDTIDEADIKLGDLEALQGVVKFPVRIKCATLAWNTLIEALAEATSQCHRRSMRSRRTRTASTPPTN